MKKRRVSKEDFSLIKELEATLVRNSVEKRHPNIIGDIMKFHPATIRRVMKCETWNDWVRALKVESTKRAINKTPAMKSLNKLVKDWEKLRKKLSR